MTLAMSRERGRPGRIGRSAHYSNSAAIYLIKHPPVRLARASHANARGIPLVGAPLPRPCGPVLRPWRYRSGLSGLNTRLYNALAEFCSVLLSFAELLLRRYLAQDRLTHCKDEC